VLAAVSPRKGRERDGVYGGREVVVPSSGMERSVSAAMIACPLMLEVFPWSVAMPRVV